MARLLVVEDRHRKQPRIGSTLPREGVEARSSERPHEAMALVRSWRPQLLLLDLDTLGVAVGVSICRLVRMDEELERTLVVLVASDAEEDDELALFDAGADDFVKRHRMARPSFQARLAALLRRTTARLPRTVRRVGPLLLDRIAARAQLEDVELPLTRTEFAILWRLAAAAGHYVSRQSLSRGLLHSVDAGVSRAVDMHVKEIRRKLGPAAFLITTRYGVGYGLDEAGDSPLRRAG
ncbi:MAG: response regulator transcription factor [Planctomycetota bacterium]|nr:response regulator transcription factor [Planctomycetota bacterium]